MYNLFRNSVMPLKSKINEQNLYSMREYFAWVKYYIENGNLSPTSPVRTLLPHRTRHQFNTIFITNRYGGASNHTQLVPNYRGWTLTIIRLKSVVHFKRSEDEFWFLSWVIGR